MGQKITLLKTVEIVKFSKNTSNAKFNSPYWQFSFSEHPTPCLPSFEHSWACLVCGFLESVMDRPSENTIKNTFQNLVVHYKRLIS